MIDVVTARPASSAIGASPRGRNKNFGIPLKAVITPTEMAELYVHDRLDLGEIARRAGVSIRAVWQAIKNATGFSPGQLRVRHGWTTYKTPASIATAILAAHHADPNAHLSLLSRTTGYSSGRIDRVLGAQDPPIKARLPPEGWHAVQTSKPLPVTCDELVALYAGGEDTMSLGRRFGVDPSTIGRRLKRAGVTLRLKGGDGGPVLVHPQTGTPLTPTDLRHLYVSQGHSAATIGAWLGLSAATVTSHMDRWHIPRRKQGGNTRVLRAGITSSHPLVGSA